MFGIFFYNKSKQKWPKNKGSENILGSGVLNFKKNLPFKKSSPCLSRKKTGLEMCWNAKKCLAVILPPTGNFWDLITFLGVEQGGFLTSISLIKKCLKIVVYREKASKTFWFFYHKNDVFLSNICRLKIFSWTFFFSRYLFVCFLPTNIFPI